MAIFELCQYDIQWSIYPPFFKTAKHLNNLRTTDGILYEGHFHHVLSFWASTCIPYFLTKINAHSCSRSFRMPANRLRLVGTRSEEAASLGADSCRKTYRLNDYSTLHVYDPFHKECLIKIMHLQHQLQDIKRFEYNFKLFYLCIIYFLYKFWCTLPEDDP
jgi:hypothetical protein